MFCIGSHLSISNGYYSMGKTALSIGANTFQYFSRNPRGSKTKEIDENDVMKLCELMKENHFGTVLAHAPYTINPCSASQDNREFSINVMREDLNRMELLPGNLYNFHPGCHVGQGSDIGIGYITDALNSILTREQHTIVLLETMAGKGSEIGRSFEEIASIIANVEIKEKVGVCVDTCHVFDAGYDIVNDLGGVLDKFDKCIGLKYLKAIHLNDSLNPLCSHKDRHAKIGEGYIGADAFRRIINNKYLKSLPFFLETPNDLLGYAKEIEMLRAMRDE